MVAGEAEQRSWDSWGVGQDGGGRERQRERQRETGREGVGEGRRRVYRGALVGLSRRYTRRDHTPIRSRRSRRSRRGWGREGGVCIVGLWSACPDDTHAGITHLYDPDGPDDTHACTPCRPVPCRLAVQCSGCRSRRAVEALWRRLDWDSEGRLDLNSEGRLDSGCRSRRAVADSRLVDESVADSRLVADCRLATRLCCRLATR